MKVSFEGIGDVMVTFETRDNVIPYSPVKICGNGTVGPCVDGDEFDGIAIDVTEDGYASVLMHGYAEFEYTGTAPTFGKCSLVASGRLTTKVDANGTADKRTVVMVDPGSKTVGFFI
ncbi:MAG: hypothetical protein IKS27_07320 [Oscillospiraceae bacterium]|jgi:hypothetical protein|nr:hypothetical protein [Oscillospiraceae bacterium]